MATIDTHTFVTNFNADTQAVSNIELMTDERGHMYPISHLFDGTTLGDSFKVTQVTGEVSRKVNISAGYIQVPYDDYAYLGWLEEDETLTIDANDEQNPRYSAIVAYINRGVQYTENQTNNPGLLLITEVKGTASATPVEVGQQKISEEVQGNPFVVLAQVYVPAGATSITQNNIIDKRVGISLHNGVALPQGSYATGVSPASGSAFTNPIQLAIIGATETVPPSSPDFDLLVCRISQ